MVLSPDVQQTANADTRPSQAQGPADRPNGGADQNSGQQNPAPKAALNRASRASGDTLTGSVTRSNTLTLSDAKSRRQTDSRPVPVRGPSTGSSGTEANSSQDIPASFVSASTLRNPFRVKESDHSLCEFCQSPSIDPSKSRNLVLCFDGSSNRFGKYNTNVVELYFRLVKDDTQISYYNSGIGTFAVPSWSSWEYWRQFVYSRIDLMIAWNFEKNLFAGYRWLSANYRPGDKIFLFGFSRGAYEARVLAGMIRKVGLILPGNEEQIPFAFELYADLRSSSEGNTAAMAARFKQTFARPNVKVHFVGAWDTVSAIGLVRGKSMPGTSEFNDDVCYFRHALALDERRVKYLPEYVCGGVSFPADGETTLVSSPIQGDKWSKSSSSKSAPRVKEVWFAGCHADIGGGNQPNEDLTNAAIPVLWMANEARFAGLRLNPSRVQWNWQELEKSRPIESLTFTWRILEMLPIKRLTYTGAEHTTWLPHLSSGRVIQPGQKIHASVCFIGGDYTPKAQFAKSITDSTGVDWTKFVGAGLGKQDGLEWAEPIKDLLEMDLFDLSNVKLIVDEVRQDMNNVDFIGRLDFLASTDEGARAILGVDGSLQLVIDLFKVSRHIGIPLLSKLVEHDRARSIILSRSDPDFLSWLGQIVQSETSDYAIGSPEAFLFLKMAERWDMLRLPYYLKRYSGFSPSLKSSDVLHMLAILYCMRFRFRGEIGDLEKAEELLRTALKAAIPPSAEGPGLLNMLAEVIRIKAHLAETKHGRRASQVLENSFLMQRNATLDASRRAVDTARELAKDGTPVSLCTLAMSLYGLSGHLVSQGHQKDALQAITESVTIYRDLYAGSPAEFTHDLAMARSSLSSILSDLGQREEALKQMQNAVALYEELAWKDGETALSQSALANSLNNLSNRLARCGNFSKALTVIERSLLIYRRLVEEYPALLEQELATCLENYSVRLDELGRREAALDAALEAVYLRKQLAEEQSQTFNVEVAKSLNNLSLRYSALGFREDAVRAANEAVERCRPLAATRPRVFNQDLAKSLQGLSLRLASAGRWEECLPVMQEAVELYRLLASDRPVEFNRDLSDSLCYMSTCLSYGGRYNDALEPLVEAVKISRQMAADFPDLHNCDLSRHLNDLSHHLGELGHREEALAAAKEAVEICRVFENGTDAIFKSALSAALFTLSRSCSEVGSPTAALEAITEAVEIQRQLVSDLHDSEVDKANLSCYLHDLSRYLADLGRKEEALVVAKEATEICRVLANDAPSLFNARLSAELYTLSQHHSNLGHHQESVNLLTEAIRIRRELAAESPDSHNPSLAEDLIALSGNLSALGRAEEALVTAQEAVDIYRHVDTHDDPTGLKSALGASLYCLSLRCSELDQRKQALETLMEGVTIHRQLAELADADIGALAQDIPLLSPALTALSSFGETKGMKEGSKVSLRLTDTRAPSVHPDVSQGNVDDFRKEALDVLTASQELCRRLTADRADPRDGTIAQDVGMLMRRLSAMGSNGNWVGSR